MSGETPPLVIDFGSSAIKAGFADEDEPSLVIPSVIGYPKYGPEKTRDFLIGDDACRQHAIMNLQYPIEHGIITNPGAMEKILDMIFTESGFNFYDKPSVLFTESPKIPRTNRYRMVQVMFETFNCSYVYCCIPEVLSLFATGRTTGMVLEIGDDVSYAVPIYEEHSIPSAIERFGLAGRDLTDWLQKSVNQRTSDPYTSYDQREMLRYVKENHTYVAQNYDVELIVSSYTKPTCLELPDNNCILLGTEPFQCPELLFKPNINEFEFDGIDKTIYKSIMKSDVDLHKDLFENIVLAGGSSMFPGLLKRLEKEVVSLAPPTIKVNVTAPENGKYSAFYGGSILASTELYAQMAIPRDEYNDTNGLTIVDYRCY